jgi:hypothetical protein
MTRTMNSAAMIAKPSPQRRPKDPQPESPAKRLQAKTNSFNTQTKSTGRTRERIIASRLYVTWLRSHAEQIRQAYWSVSAASLFRTFYHSDYGLLNLSLATALIPVLWNCFDLTKDSLAQLRVNSATRFK